MKILFLEDSAERIKLAKPYFIGHTVHYAETAEEAIKLLQANKFDIASLDHDLGGTVMSASDKNSGFAVAEFIAENVDFQPEYVIIHSMNPIGAEDMIHCLTNAQKHVETRYRVVRAVFNTAEYWSYFA